MPINMFAALTGDRPYRHPILDAMRKADRVEDIPYRGPTFVPSQAVADLVGKHYGGTPVEVMPVLPSSGTTTGRWTSTQPRFDDLDRLDARTCTYCGRDGHGAPSCPWRPAQGVDWATDWERQTR